MKNEIRHLFKRIYKTAIMQRLIAFCRVLPLVLTFISGVFVYEVFVNYFFALTPNIALGLLGIFVGIITMIYAIHLGYKKA